LRKNETLSALSYRFSAIGVQPSDISIVILSDAATQLRQVEEPFVFVQPKRATAARATIVSCRLKAES
jgi:hypothetical protein